MVVIIRLVVALHVAAGGLCSNSLVAVGAVVSQVEATLR